MSSDLIAIAGGAAPLGTDGPDAIPGDGEGPARIVELAPYRIGRFAVSNDEFAGFADATGYVTDAEREGWSFVFAGFLPDDHPPTRGVVGAPWWRQVYEASWRAPAGPASSLEGIGDHPVVHVSQRDALAYCAWAGVRLPTDEEWEHAARGGLVGAPLPWGDELLPGGEHRANIWQGDFPIRNTGEDGYLGTAPVDAFAPNRYGLHNVAGNVWEWTSTPFTAPNAEPGAVITRGGSHLCHESYCNRYRVSAKTGNTPDSSTGHIGFRVAADAG